MTSAIESAVPTVDEVVARIKDNVWTLMCAGQVNGALVLMESQREDFMRAWRLENLGVVQPVASTEVVHAEPVTCVSTEHVRVDCHEAIALGELAGDACRWCIEHPPAAKSVVSVVRVVSAVDNPTSRKAVNTRRPRKQLAKTG